MHTMVNASPNGWASTRSMASQLGWPCSLLFWVWTVHVKADVSLFIWQICPVCNVEVFGKEWKGSGDQSTAENAGGIRLFCSWRLLSFLGGELSVRFLYTRYDTGIGTILWSGSHSGPIELDRNFPGMFQAIFASVYRILRSDCVTGGFCLVFSFFCMTYTFTYQIQRLGPNSLCSSFSFESSGIFGFATIFFFQFPSTKLHEELWMSQKKM